MLSSGFTLWHGVIVKTMSLCYGGCVRYLSGIQSRDFTHLYVHLQVKNNFLGTKLHLQEFYQIEPTCHWVNN